MTFDQTEPVERRAIRVLVVDDSATMRRIVQTVLESAGDIEAHFARSGEEAISMLPQVAPDVITLDIILTGMDGLECLERVMKVRPCPVVMVSSLTSEGATNTSTALSMGAVDFIQKPQGPLGPDLEPFRSLLIRKVRDAAQACVTRPLPAMPRIGSLSDRTPNSAPAAVPPSAGPVPSYFPVVVVGASTGGPPALEAILTQLPGDFPAAVIIAQHMPAAFTAPLAARIGRRAAVPIEEVSGSVQIRPGTVYIGRGDADLVVGRRQDSLIASSVDADPQRKWHPSVDRLAESAMRAADPRRLVGVLLTGMGDDGASSMTELRRLGGRTIAEARETAVVWGMPGALVQAGGADRVVPLHDVPRVLHRLVG